MERSFIAIFLAGARPADAGLLVHVTTGDIKSAFDLAAGRRGAREEGDRFHPGGETHLEAHAPGWKHRRTREIWLKPDRPLPPIRSSGGSIAEHIDIMAEHIQATVRRAIAGAAEAGKRGEGADRGDSQRRYRQGRARRAMRGNPAHAKLIAACRDLTCSKRQEGRPLPFPPHRAR